MSDSESPFFVTPSALVPVEDVVTETPIETPVEAPVEKFKVKKSNTQIAAEVWLDQWGEGDDRKNRLTDAGYNAEFIQDLVNRGVGHRL